MPPRHGISGEMTWTVPPHWCDVLMITNLTICVWKCERIGISPRTFSLIYQYFLDIAYTRMESAKKPVSSTPESRQEHQQVSDPTQLQIHRLRQKVVRSTSRSQTPHNYKFTASDKKSSGAPAGLRPHTITNSPPQAMASSGRCICFAR